MSLLVLSLWASRYDQAEKGSKTEKEKEITETRFHSISAFKMLTGQRVGMLPWNLYIYISTALISLISTASEREKKMRAHLLSSIQGNAKFD